MTLTISQRELEALTRAMLAVLPETKGQDKAALHRVLNRIDAMMTGQEFEALLKHSRPMEE